MAVIELGELTAGEPSPVPEMSGRTRRALLAALVVVACLLGVAGAVPAVAAVAGLAEPRWSGEASLAGFELGPTNVYLAEPDGRVVYARDLATGVERWRLPIDGLPVEITHAGDGLVAVQTRAFGRGESGPTTVTLVREDTGRVVATATGRVLGPTGRGHRLLLADTAELRGDTCPMWTQPCTDLISLDATSGAEVARVRLSRDGRYQLSTVDDLVEGFVTYSPGGPARVYDAGTGEVVDSMAMPEGQESFVALTPDRLLTARRDGDAIRVVAYRRGPLRPMWEVTVAAPPPSQYPTWWMAGAQCGPVVCVSADGRTVLLDRDTGRTRFSYPGEVAGSVGGGVIAGYTARPGSEGRLDVQLLDPLTGAVVATVPGVVGMPWPGSGGRILLAQAGTDRTGFIVVGPDGHPRTLGSVDGVGLRCRARAGVLACSSPSGLLRVWSLPLP